MALSEPDDRKPEFPPVFDGMAAEPGRDPFQLAIELAREGIDPGLIVYKVRTDHLSAALVLAPETSLADAMPMVLVAAIGFADSFGALAPSEVAAQFDWPGGFRINGARCGGLRAAASVANPGSEPDWLVIGIDVPFFAQTAAEPGTSPDQTTLWDEGCSEIDPCRLLESWSRHTLVWMNDWMTDGIGRIHADWTGRAYSIGKEVEIIAAGNRYVGEFLGLDERGGLLLKTIDGTIMLPLTDMLEKS